MKKLFFLCLTACLGMWASAQKVYFLYLQSDDQSPFYVRIGDKIHSSAASGFLILPNLTDSNYNFGLGFARSTDAEAKFSVTINGGDKGYIIKNFDDGLGLFDFQNLSVVKANIHEKDNTVYETKSDKFSSILSKAASDPSILKVPVAKKDDAAKSKPAEKEQVTVKLEEAKQVEKPVINEPRNQAQLETQPEASQTTAQKPETRLPDPATQQTATNTKEETKPVGDSEKKETLQPVETVAKKEDTAPINAAYTPSVITRFSESSTTEGFGLVYFDKKGDGTDTIRILIPASKVKLAPSGDAATGDEQVKSDKEEPAVPEKQVETAPPAEVKQIEKASVDSGQPAKTATANPTCKNTASDRDFIKLRKRMAAKENEDDMLDEARKEFRGRCYNVEQLRYLSTLFLTSASKYQFFDAAYQYVTDKSNFSSLGAEIRDEHYTKRFKALIGE